MSEYRRCVPAQFPQIVTLCGSSRFYREFQEMYYARTMAGETALSIGFCPHAGTHGEGTGHDSAEKLLLDELHKRKIDLADYVMVVSDPSGYFGDSTADEIRYARQRHKPVAFLHKTAFNRAEHLGLI